MISIFYHVSSFPPASDSSSLALLSCGDGALATPRITRSCWASSPSCRQFFASLPITPMTSITAPPPCAAEAHDVLAVVAPVAADQRQILIDSICRIVQSHFNHGAASVQIADVPNFSTAEQCARNIADMSLGELQYIHGLMTGERNIPRPQSLGGPTGNLQKHAS